MLYLRKYCESNDIQEARAALYKYCEELEREGWLEDDILGGYTSPDQGSIFYYNGLYEGQLKRFKYLRQYEDYVKEVLEKNIFVLRR